jgi:ParB-like chromosome segregation protein Spo0J
MTHLAQRVVDEKLSVRRTEDLVREMLDSPREPSSATPQRGATTPDEFHQASRLMHEALELPVRVKSLKSGGKVEIRFRQQEELQALVSLLTAQDDN